MNIISNIPNFEPISGIVTDGVTLKPLPGVKISDKLGNQTLTNFKGEFKFKTPKLENGHKPQDYPITFSKSKYTIHTEIPYISTLDVKSSLGVIKIFTVEYSTQIEVLKDQSTSRAETEAYNKQFRTADVLAQEKINKVKADLKNKAIPLIYTLAASYGVSQLNLLLGKSKEELKQFITCPPKAEVDRIIAVKNKLVKQINISLNVINKASDLLTKSEAIISATNTAINILELLPTPTAVAGVGIPISVINGVQKAIKFLDNLVGKLLNINTTTLLAINLLKLSLGQVLSYLTLLDTITQICSPDTTQEQISAELTALTIQQSTQTSPVVTNVNGFDMGVETENSPNTLKRRRAIAKNINGVTVLTGEWSFSSIDQILIDELVFYIQQNNLKAY